MIMCYDLMTCVIINHNEVKDWPNKHVPSFMILAHTLLKSRLTCDWMIFPTCFCVCGHVSHVLIKILSFGGFFSLAQFSSYPVVD